MTINAFQAAKKICEFGNWSVTNLQLQKILYLAHMIYMGRNNKEPLIYESFEAWDYGPVLSSLYHRVKIFGEQPIKNIFIDIPDLEDGTKEVNLLKEACDKLLHQPPSKLVAFTHQPKGAWASHYCAGEKGCLIPNEAVFEEYKKNNYGK
jgi:uncharacterized phage-associated protein